MKRQFWGRQAASRMGRMVFPLPCDLLGFQSTPSLKMRVLFVIASLIKFGRTAGSPQNLRLGLRPRFIIRRFGRPCES